MDTLHKLFTLIKALVDREFYGKMKISFEKGKIVNTKVTESIKL